MGDRIYLAAVSGRPKEICDAWRERFHAARDQWHEFGREIGASQLFGFSTFEKPTLFSFPSKSDVPDGWTKPDRRGRTRPKRSNTEFCDRIAALPEGPSLDELAAELGLPTSIQHSHGFCRVGGGSFHAYTPCWWQGGPVILRTSDFRELIAQLAAEGCKDVRVNQGPGDIPEGLKVMTEAEVDLGFAHARVAQEKAA